MNTRLIFRCIVIVLFIIFAFVPFIAGRVRARWAKRLFFIIAVLGVAVVSFNVALEDLRLFTPDSQMNRAILVMTSAAEGLILGFIFSLIMSGQLFGKEKDEPCS